MSDDDVDMSDESEDDVENKNQKVSKRDKVKPFWTRREDEMVVDYVKKTGEKNWETVATNTGLSRTAVSCEARWYRNLRSDLKKSAFSEEEELRIMKLHEKYGYNWAKISRELPGRSPSDIRDFWKTKMELSMAGNSSGIARQTNESGEFHMQEGSWVIPIPNPDIAHLQSHDSLPRPTSTPSEVPLLPSGSYNSNPFVNASVMIETPLVFQNIYYPELVTELLGKLSQPSLVNVNTSTCLSTQSTPAADQPLCLNQSSPPYPCRPVHTSPLDSIGDLQDSSYHEKNFLGQITRFSTVVLPTKDVNQRSYVPLGGNASFTSNAFSKHECPDKENQPFDEDAFVRSFLNDDEEPDDPDNPKPDDDACSSSRS